MRAANFLVLLLAFLTSLAPAWADGPSPMEDEIVAVVATRPITQREVIARARLQFSYRQLEATNDPRAEAERAQLLQIALRDIMEEELVRLEAKNRKIELGREDKRELEDFLERRAKLYGGLSSLEATLRERGTSLEALRDAENARLLMGKLYFEIITKELFLGPRDLRDAFESHPELYTRKAKTQVRRIRLTYRPDEAPDEIPSEIRDWLKLHKLEWSAAACRQLADEIRRRIREGEDAGRLARKYTMRESERESNGLLEFESDKEQWASTEDIPSIDALVRGLREGDCSEVGLTEGRGGTQNLDLVILETRRKRDLEDFERAQEKIRRLLRSAGFQRSVQEFRARLFFTALEDGTIKKPGS